MREVEFRGKTKDGEWVYGVPTYDGASGEKIIINGIDGYDCPFDIINPETICQYIGLKDKKGEKDFRE